MVVKNYNYTDFKDKNGFDFNNLFKMLKTHFKQKNNHKFCSIKRKK